jgi:hypothetical protein
VKIGEHPEFKNGFPYVDIEDFENLYEGMEIGTCGFPLGNLLAEQLGTVTSSFTKGILSSIIPAPSTQRHLVSAFQLDLTATHGNSGGPVFNFHNGKIFGVIQGGVLDANNKILPGITKAESIYKVFDENLIEEVLNTTSDDIKNMFRDKKT